MSIYQHDINNDDVYDALPDLPKILQENQKMYSSYTTDVVPPIFSTTNSIVSETLNSDPYLIRSTMYKVPVSEYALVESNIPFSIILTPFNDKSVIKSVEGEEKCERCRSYASKLTKNTNNSFTCQICNKQMVILDTSILHSSTYDIVRSKVCNFKPVFLFLIDLGANIFSQNVFSVIREVLQDDNFNYLYENIAFIVLYEHNIITFEMQNGKITILKMNGIAAPKISSNIIIKTEDKTSINIILEYLENIKQISKGKIEENVYLEKLSELSKICPVNAILFTNSFSNFNFEEYLEKNRNLSINLFTTCDKKENTLSRLAFYSSGKVFVYKSGQINFKNDLLQIASTKSVFNLNIQLRLSGNLVKTDIIAPTLNTNLGKLTLNHMDSTTSVLYNLSLTEPSIEDKYIQAEINYTDFDGLRKTRILNLKLEASKNIYLGLSPDTIFAAFVKMKLDEDINLEEKLAKLFMTYRMKNGYKQEGNLIMPTMCGILPVLFQALNKKVNPDNKFLFSASVEQCLKYFYPTMISLSGYAVEPETAKLRLSKRNIFDGEIYFLENSREIFMFITRNTEQILLDRIFKGVFETSSVISIDNFNSQTEEGRLCIKIVQEMFERYNYTLKINLVFAGQTDEIKIQSYMVEDDINGKGDYITYIYRLHSDIKRRIG